MEVSVAVYLVGGGLFCQAKNSLNLSWKKKKRKKDRTSGCLAYGFIHLVTCGAEESDDFSFPD